MHPRSHSESRTHSGRPRPSPLESIQHPAAELADVQLFCKRDDLYTPAPGTALQGNKVRKLAPILNDALASGDDPVLLSFGGAYSNHVAALATAGKLYNLRVHLIIRGEEVDNPLLDYCTTAGARLEKISRTEYRQKHDPAWVETLRQKIAAEYDISPAHVWLIPEGGTTEAGIENMRHLYDEITADLSAYPDYLALSAGTGGTAAGIIRAANARTKVEVYPALKGNWMQKEIAQHLASDQAENWSCVTGYHHGGYGKYPKKWITQSSGLATRADVGEPGLPPLEPIYTAKLFTGVLDRIANGHYPPGSTVVVIHTGGIY
ncbi:1-aminocyclopropane-1-carboxylate deaminase/D-cysteine desulfhydrase [Neolewinella antarctica]|uniref:1-aminocyclopropane-1-carboxylate deaminase n=1 Tax=Neolewinella antarctica TaxID=442734 RepID=A0ABX0XGS4_9BACT|nr:pyridoxal-phosphate dependent enzyme [Neolewinella antarctica]NJC28411.1 1-aminocyclopropane-1-carboxylate deaminase [Neolewinella antarctica]